MQGSTSSNDNILNEATGVEPGCVEIMPLNLVTLHVLTWLYSLQTDTRNFSDRVTYMKVTVKNKQQTSPSISIKTQTLVTELWCTVNVWNSWGPCPTVSGCWTITRTVPELVPYAISIQFPLTPTINYIHIKS